MRALFFLIFLFAGLTQNIFAETPKVIASIAPTKYIVEKIAKDKVACLYFVPPGTSPHSYEPSLRQVIVASEAVLWFRIGEGFENKVARALEKKMKIVDTRDRLSLLSSKCCHEEIDTHIWLSPSLLKIQAETICSALSETFPAEASFFEENLRNFIVEVTNLDVELKTQCRDTKANRTFLVAHPAFGYFCRDYHFEELSIEIGGKDPTAKQITSLIREAKEKKVDKIIIHPQYSTRGAKILAKELNARMISIDPYHENVFENLRAIAQALTS